MSANDSHLENASVPMLFTDCGMVMLVKLEHQRNASSPMLVTELGMTMLVKLLQP